MIDLRDYAKKEQLEKIQRFRILNSFAQKGKILFTGSSLMEQFPINELLMDRNLNISVYNRGIGGFTTDDMLEYMEEQIFGTEPSVIFINIGTNDLGNPENTFEENLEHMLANYEKILDLTREKLPETEIYMMAYYPVNETFADKAWPGAFTNRNNHNLAVANEKVRELAERKECHFIDANENLADKDGRLKAEYTVEGVHMYGNAYQIVLDNLLPVLKEKLNDNHFGSHQ